jgi:DNA-binding response OmpR family regulator
MTDETGKILVVDDSPHVCKALSDVLKASGYEVRTAPSGERALQIVEADRFDLVITDLKMSGMSGMDLARQIFAQLPGVPVVILTGFGDMDAVIDAMRSGVADFLKKPFSIDEVLSVVRRELGKSQARVVAMTAQTQLNNRPERPPRVYIFNQSDIHQIEAVLSKLRAQAAAESALLVEQAGYVIAAKGMVSSADLEPISNLIAGTRTTSASLASLLGETQDFSTSYMEGQRVSVYMTVLGRGLYLVVIVPKGTKQGLVWLYAKEAAVEIDRIVRRATEAMQQQLGRTVSDADAEALHKEMAEQKVENVFEPKSAPEPVRPRPSPRPLGTISTIVFKKDRPEPEVTSKPAAGPPQSADDEGGLSFEEAQPAGLTNVSAEADLPPAEPNPDVPALSFDEALKLGLVKLDVPVAPPEEPPADTSADTLTPDRFAAALENGLLDFEAAPPDLDQLVEPQPPAQELTPDSFEEALRRGLLDFGSDQSSEQ